MGGARLCAPVSGACLVMEIVTENLLYRGGAMNDCPIGGLPRWIAIGGDELCGEVTAWASLLTGFVWSDREHFLFVFDGGLKVGDSLWLKYRDEWHGLVELIVEVVSVVARSGSFEIQASGKKGAAAGVLAA